MLLLDFQTQSFETAPANAGRESLEVSLAAGGHIAFSTHAREIEVGVRSGRVWLTDGPVDHVLAADGLPRQESRKGQDALHVCPSRSRVVITALTDAVLTIGRPALQR